LQRQLGDNVSAPDLIAYLERRDIEDEKILYERGELADRIEFSSREIATVGA
jgi:hypothetical protein